MSKKQIKQINESENILIKNRFLVIAIFVIAVYSQVVSFTYTGFDDDFLVAKNITELSNWDNISKIFTGNSFLSNAVFGFYRPLQTLSFMFDAKIGSGELWAFHLTNLLLHLFCCYLLYSVLIKLNIKKQVAFILSLIFSIHPMFSINIAWLPARGDLLVAVFGLSSFLLFLKYAETKKIILLITQSIVLLFALFSKESAVVLPIIFLCYYILTNRKFDLNLLLLSASWIITGLIWFLMRNNAISELPDTQLFGFIPFVNNLQTIPEYIAKFVVPYKIMALPVYRLDITIVGIIVLIAGTIIFIKTKIQSLNLVFLGLLWFLLLVLPGMFYSRLDSNPEYFYQYLDHRAYLALIGIIIILSTILQTSIAKFTQKTYVFFGVVVAIVFALISFNHTKIFANPDLFLTQAINDNPKASVAYFLHANVKKDEMKFDEAILLYSNAININQNYAEALNNRGSLNAMMSNYNNAISDLNRAIQINPQIPDGYFNRAMSFGAVGKFKEAISDYRKALELQPKDLSILFAIANTYNAMNDIEQAINTYTQVIKRKPDYAEAFYNRANAYASINQSQRAIEDYSNAIAYNPQYLNAYLNRAVEKYKSGDKTAACEDWTKAVNLGSSPARQMIERYCK